jgi:glucokinase
MIRSPIDPHAGSSAIQAQILDLVAELRRRQAPTGFAAIGVGFGGPVDTSAGRILHSHQVQGWDGFPLAEWLSNTTRIPLVAIDNDSDAAALAEARFGAGKGLSPLLYVNSGSGVGGGLVIAGEVYRGAGQGTLEIGHLLLSLDGQPPTPLESIASGWAIARAGQDAVRHSPDQTLVLRRLCDNRPDCITGRMVGQAALARDPGSCAIITRATRAMALGLAHAVTLLAPRRIVLGGGVALLPEDLWLDPIRRELESLVYPGFRDSYDVIPAALREEVVVHGALALARSAWTVLASS